MQWLQEHSLMCPYCGEKFLTVVNLEDDGNEYIEDCQICCKPIIFHVTSDHLGHLILNVRDENQA